jgi:hypothetical protein
MPRGAPQINGETCSMPMRDEIADIRTHFCSPCRVWYIPCKVSRMWVCVVAVQGLLYPVQGLQDVGIFVRHAGFGISCAGAQGCGHFCSPCRVWNIPCKGSRMWVLVVAMQGLVYPVQGLVNRCWKANNCDHARCMLKNAR